VDLFLGRCFRAAALWLAWRPARPSATDKEASERCRPSALSSRGSSKLMTCGIRAVRQTRPPAVGIQPSCYREKTVSHRVTTVSDCGRQQGNRVCSTADAVKRRSRIGRSGRPHAVAVRGVRAFYPRPSAPSLKSHIVSAGLTNRPMGRALYKSPATTNQNDIHLILNENYNQAFSNWSRKIENVHPVKDAKTLR